MSARSPLDDPPVATCLTLRGLEANSLLAFMALLGLLRALDHTRPDWSVRVRWTGRPWTAALLLDAAVSEDDVAAAADEGVLAIAGAYRLAPEGANQGAPRDVKFSADAYRAIIRDQRATATGSALVSALSAEHPRRKDGSVMPGPLVLLFGQGHQHFLDRLTSVPMLPAPLVKPKRGEKPPKVPPTGSSKMMEALFAPWSRGDETDSFRWDPADDQRYALRFGDPSKSGAARTTHGANRLAAVGLLSFPCVAGEYVLEAVGSLRAEGTRHYLWPIWTEPLTLAGIETLLMHDLAAMGSPERSAFGIAQVMRARRVSNGKFMNVTLGAET